MCAYMYGLHVANVPVLLKAPGLERRLLNWADESGTAQNDPNDQKRSERLGTQSHEARRQPLKGPDAPGRLSGLHFDVSLTVTVRIRPATGAWGGASHKQESEPWQIRETSDPGPSPLTRGGGSGAVGPRCAGFAPRDSTTWTTRTRHSSVAS